MNLLSFFRIRHFNVIRYALGYLSYLAHRLFIRCLKETRYLAEIHLAILRECLHRIEHPVMLRLSLQHVHRYAPRRMHQHSILRLQPHFLGQSADSIILNRNDIYVSISVDFIDISSISTTYLPRQLASMLFRTTKHLQDLLSRIPQSPRQLRSQIPRTNYNYIHNELIKPTSFSRSIVRPHSSSMHFCPCRSTK